MSDVVAALLAEDSRGYSPGTVSAADSYDDGAVVTMYKAGDAAAERGEFVHAAFRPVLADTHTGTAADGIEAE